MQAMVRRLRSKNYGRVIEVRLPVRFYWNEDCTFDGVEFGPIPPRMTRWQHRLLSEVLETISLLVQGRDVDVELALREHLEARDEAVKEAGKLTGPVGG